MSNVTLHHLNVSRSERIFWCLEELGLDYNVVVYKRLPTRSAPPELKKISPLGRAPVLEIDGHTILESGAIISYLLQNYGGPKAKGYNQTDTYWAHYAEGSLMILLQMSAVIGATSKGFVAQAKLNEDEQKGVSKYADFLQEQYLRGHIQTNLDMVNDFLVSSESGFFSGHDEPGVGDYQMYFPINSFLRGSRKDLGFKLGQGIRAWHQKVSARPACQKGMQRLQEEEKKKDQEDAAKAKDGQAKM